MFTTSTQKHFWIFADDEALKNIREETNRKFVDKHSNDLSDIKVTMTI